MPSSANHPMLYSHAVGCGCSSCRAEVEQGTGSDDTNSTQRQSTTLTDTITWGTALSDKVITVYFVPNGESRTYDSFEDDITSEGFTAYEKAQFQQAFDRMDASEKERSLEFG